MLAARNVTIISVLILSAATLVISEKCTTCKDGGLSPNPENPINIKGLDINSCALVDLLVGSLDADMPLCETAQSVSTLCGCPIEESACTLCSDGSRVAFPDVELEEYLALDYIRGTPEGALLNCQTLEAYLHSKDANSDICISSQDEVYSRCGCPEPIRSDDYWETTRVPQNTEPPRQFCTVCVDGEPMGMPDKPLTLGDDVDIQSCKDLDRYASFYWLDSKTCQGIQTISTFCGCSYQRNECSFCANGEPTPLPDKQLPWLRDVITFLPEEYRFMQNSLTCEMYESLLLNVEDATLGLEKDLLCLAGQFKSRACGCTYDWRPIVLVWAYRISGILSLLGSTYILWDILSNKHKRKTTYHQLVLGISFFDCISSLAYALATVMVPEDTGLYGATGNEVSCRFQGGMIQLGLTSVFYNAYLSIYFLLMVKYNWREQHFVKYRRWAHIPVNMLGLGMAFGATPFYFPQLAVCYIVQPPIAKNWLPLSFFYTLPITLALFTLVYSTIVICIKVFTQEKAVRKWTTRQQNWSLSRKVFWQSFWYVLSFMVTLPLLIISYFLKFRSYDSYYLFLVAGFLAPLQGTLNAFVYFHRDKKFRCLTYWCQCVCFRPKRAEGSSVLVTGSVPVVAPGVPRISSNIRSEYVSRKSHQSKHIASMVSEASLTMDPVNEEQSQESSQGGDEFAGVLDFWDLMYQNGDQLDTEGNSVRGTNNAAEEANENSESREDDNDEHSGRLLRFLHTIRAHGFDPQTEESNDQQSDCDKEQKNHEKWEDSSLERQEEPQAFA